MSRILEIARDYKAGQISRDEMIEILTRYPYKRRTQRVEYPEPLPPSWEEGTIDELGKAMAHGYLTRQDYRDVLAARDVWIDSQGT